MRVVGRHVPSLRNDSLVNVLRQEFLSQIDPLLNVFLVHLDQVFLLEPLVVGREGNTHGTRHDDIRTPVKEFSVEVGQ
jgi:hypothetical protein